MYPKLHTYVQERRLRETCARENNIKMHFLQRLFPAITLEKVKLLHRMENISNFRLESYIVLCRVPRRINSA